MRCPQRRVVHRAASEDRQSSPQLQRVVDPRGGWATGVG
ncbi:hypothetical protein BKA14_007393 [Actinoplanes abujensis]|uniref:Uncharacterized protein n=1 Tax=Paractinoplanes abujensis TaxID=882441 RepID=A0A7W7CYX7_9ACTN|nr:hypothetical protein [Actinoplanes abujensis]